MDPALKRAGRFDKKIPILLPDEAERAGVFEVIMRKNKFCTNITDFSPFAKRTEGYTGAEIEVVIRKAYELTCDRGMEIINSERLNEAVDKCQPNTDQIELMTELALWECDDKDMLKDYVKN